MEKSKRNLSTLAVHAGEKKERTFGAVTPPIFQTSTFYFPTDDEQTWEGIVPEGSYIYTRHGNPTLRMAEDKIAVLEGAERGLVFSSGMASIATTLITFLEKNDVVVSIRDVYGGTHSLMKRELPRMGIRVVFVDSANTEEILETVEKYSPKVLYLESPTNPLLKIVDIPKVTRKAHELGTIVIIDNTFATPVNQNPIDMGVDIVIHSCTKYLNGHSDLIAGAVVGKSKHMEEIAKRRIVFGGVLDPFGAFLLLRGLKTLAVRMQKHNENGKIIAEYLESNKSVERVYYPGLASHPQHNLAKSLLRGFGGMVSFEIAGGRREAERMLKTLHLIKLATSLGGVESLASMPFNTSHASLSQQEREQLGIKDTLIRLSIGIEDSEDIVRDLDQAIRIV